MNDRRLLTILNGHFENKVAECYENPDRPCHLAATRAL